MSSSPDPVYSPLPNTTSIRVLLLAPGEPDDSDVFCWLLPSDLDWDHDRFPGTTPRPVESISMVTGKLASGETRKFPMRFDMDFEFGRDSTPIRRERMHPFQRYEALSYVWGDPSDSQYIFLGGENQFPVTKNLYAALRSLRLPHAGRRLWIDALCINQNDHEEKEIQIGLMKRVYQQAKKVIAYLPLPIQDQKNIAELVPKILHASKLCEEDRDRKEKSGSGPGQYTGPFNSISELATAKVATNESEPLTVAHSKQTEWKTENLFLEDFGLPPEDSPLWDSWRRLFASPYFRRIWILQEIALGKELQFWFGDAGGSAEELMVAHHLLGLYSGTMNVRYIASGSLSHQDAEGFLKTAIVGSQSASRMFLERLSAKSGKSESRLIEKLATVTAFQATDPRDKIYALLGLTSDGAFFARHVSYAPQDSAEQIFVKFAKLFIERNEGIEVLLQAGLREDQEGWPSWVPHWDNLDLVVEAEAARSSGKSSTSMRVDGQEQTLNISGNILDDVEVVNNSVFETLEVTPNGVSMTSFIGSLVAGFKMIFETSSSRDPEQIFERLFQVLAQPKPPREKSITQDLEAKSSQDSARDWGSPEDPSGSATSSAHAMHDDADKENEDDTRVLRAGFHELLNYIVTLHTQLSDLSEGVVQMSLMKSPNEYQSFLKRAMNTTGHRRLCVTKGGHIGLSPKRTRVGDSVAVFEGSDIHFILRRVKPLSEEDLGEGEGRFKLIGPAYFHIRERVMEGLPAAMSKNIMIV